MRKILFLIICLVSFPYICNAASCSNEEIGKISGFSSNVNIVYLVNMKNNVPEFSITITNLTSDMALIDKNTSKLYKDFKNGDRFTITTKTSGKYAFDIYSLKCKVKTGTKSVTLPKYNPYYKDELCKGLEEYTQCQRWSGYTANRATFENDIKKLKEVQNKEEMKEETKIVVKKSLYKKVEDIILNYWWAISIVLILLIGLFYIIRNKRKKNEYNFKV